MRFIDTGSQDVFYNLALEEYVLNYLTDDDYVLLWVSDPCIVIGKYQNVFEEINCKEIEKKGIKVARRNTGGGTVFHDAGNLNYSFITDYDARTFAGYDSFLSPMIKILNYLGVPALKRNTSDIAVGVKKISGSAQTIKNNRILHHGSLLFDADLKSLRDLLKPPDGFFESKAIKSVRSEVANIKDYLTDRNMNMAGFKKAVLHSLFQNSVNEKILSETEMGQVKEMAEKYTDWDWTFGNSPCFAYEKEDSCHGSKISVRLLVDKGIIKECSLNRDGLSAEKIQSLLLGQRYAYFGLADRLEKSIGIGALAECLF